MRIDPLLLPLPCKRGGFVCLLACALELVRPAVRLMLADDLQQKLKMLAPELVVEEAAG